MSRSNGTKAARTLLKQQDTRGLLAELGGTGLDTTGGYVHEEFLTSLQWDLAKKVYKEMESNDPIVGAMLYAIEMLIRPVTWTTQAFEQTPEDEANAEFVRQVVDDMSHTWSSFMGEWMAAPTYGFAPFEIVWKRRNGYNRSPGKSSKYDDGKVGIRKLAIRHPDTLYRWEFDDAGGVQAMIQWGPPTFETVTIPIDKLLLFTTLQRKGSPQGTSLLRRSYVPWYRKKRIEESEAIGIERELAGLPMITAPYQWFLSNASSGEKALLAQMKRIVRRIRSDEEMGLVLPAIYDANNNQTLKFELVSTNGRRAIDTSAAKEYYSRQIAMSILADVILIGHEQVGSFALASSKTNLFSAGLNAMLDDVEAVLNRHLIPRLLQLNGMPMDRPPYLSHGDVETPDLDVLGQYVERLAGAGMQLFPSEEGELERQLMRAANLPEDIADVSAQSSPLGDGELPPDGAQSGAQGLAEGAMPD